MVISWSWAVTANIRQERIGSPSTSTVQAPQTPCSQPTWVPVSRRSWRRKSDSSRRAGTDAVRGTPLTCSVTSWSCSVGLVGRHVSSSRWSTPSSWRAVRPAASSQHARRVELARRASAGSRRWRGCRASGSTCARTGLGGRGPVGRAPTPGRARTSVRSSTRGTSVTETNDARGAGDDAVGRGHRGGDPGQGVVAVPAGRLHEAPCAVPAREAAEPRGDGQLVLGQGRLERADEEVAGRDLPAAPRGWRPRPRRRSGRAPPASRRPGRRGRWSRPSCRGCGSPGGRR